MKSDPTVLVVAPLSGHHATLLRDTVRTLLPDHKVYVTDWIDARMVPKELGTFSLDDYVGYIEDFRSEAHTSELQSLMRISYAVFCLKQKKNTHPKHV